MGQCSTVGSNCSVERVHANTCHITNQNMNFSVLQYTINQYFLNYVCIRSKNLLYLAVIYDLSNGKNYQTSVQPTPLPPRVVTLYGIWSTPKYHINKMNRGWLKAAGTFRLQNVIVNCPGVLLQGDNAHSLYCEGNFEWMFCPLSTLQFVIFSCTVHCCLYCYYYFLKKCCPQLHWETSHHC